MNTNQDHEMSKNNTLINKKILGLYILTLGIAFLLKIIFPQINLIIFVNIVLIVVALHFIIHACCNRKKKRLIIPGIILLLSSIFFMLYLSFLSDIISFNKIWPVLGFFPAISLCVYYLISDTKSPAVVIPGIFIFLMSLVLFLITLDILELEFMNFLMMLISSMTIFIGLFLIFYKKNERDRNNEK